jgi:hypothetical protein
MFKVACLWYEICGTATYFADEAEYEVYGDDFQCAECLDVMDMKFFTTVGWE